MNYTQLSLGQAPSIATPLRFLITAPLFAIAAALLFIINGPEMFQSRWLPNTLAATHLITLGFVTMSMMGALFQLLPVLAGSIFPKSSITSPLIHTLFSSGVICFTMGLANSQPLLIKIALFLLLPALLIFLIGASISLYKAQSSHASVRGMKYSILALWITLILGTILASGHGWQQLSLLRQFTELHVAWASIGWITLMTIAIAFQVIPMFQVTNSYPNIIQRALIPGIFITMVCWTLSRYFTLSSIINLSWLSTALELIICLLLLTHVVVSIRLQMQRKKRLIDSSLYFWLTGLISLAISIALFLYSKISISDQSMLLGLLFFSGFVSSIINGMYYKIIPFLIWLNLNRKLAFTNRTLSSIPTMNEVIPFKQSFTQFLLHIASITMTIAAVFYPSVFYYPAVISWLLSWSLLFILIVKSLLIYRNCLAT
ncbi:MAG: hypothetical protein OQL09_05545 [Gammaproteobacteria bacterium]|nr:hypothetical protein [Gammaproteobacteria bacterium]